MVRGRLEFIIIPIVIIAITVLGFYSTGIGGSSECSSITGRNQQPKCRKKEGATAAEAKTKATPRLILPETPTNPPAEEDPATPPDLPDPEPEPPTAPAKGEEPKAPAGEVVTEAATATYPNPEAPAKAVTGDTPEDGMPAEEGEYVVEDEGGNETLVSRNGTRRWIRHKFNFILKEREYEKVNEGFEERRASIAAALDTYTNSSKDPRWLNNSLFLQPDELHSAIILESRAEQHLTKVIQHYMDRLPPEVYFFVFHGPDNAKLLSNTFQQQIKTGKMLLFNLKTNVSKYDYQWTFLNMNFWEKIAGNNILVFQSDTALCKNSPHTIKEFLMWDYVGAPCTKFRFGGNTAMEKIMRKKLPTKRWKDVHYNGGLSLRKRSKMLEALSFHMRFGTPIPWHIYEDVFFTSRMWSGRKMMIPWPNIARRFCFEYNFYPTPLGIHKPWERTWFHDEEERKIRENCPEIKELFGM
mmetsp:Transcript_79851/g.140925  ORF Transcript_79851/g.140925 Transcript_79851/m.140925 type:complete len:469 (-) Transcript_79851:383-1789(-)